jgi:DNA-3-methyladenine glycosylase I
MIRENLAAGVVPVPDLTLRPLTPADAPRVAAVITDSFGSERVIAHETEYLPAQLPGIAAELSGELAGLVTYHLGADGCEVVTLNSLIEGQGVGTELLEAVRQVALEWGCRRVWLVATNDNLRALGFYQRRGYELVGIRRGAVTAARRVKPEIPLVGASGIPIRDEIELELTLVPEVAR